MKNRIIIFLFFLISFQTFANTLSKEEISKLNFNQLQKLRWAYIEFVIEAEKDNPGVVTSMFSEFSVFPIAYADTKDLCFFGGWPSVIVAGKCRRPWRSKNINEVKEYGGYTPEYACGSKDQFRCNPVLFGSPDKTGKGHCIKTGGTFKQLTTKCEKVSRGNISSLINSYKSNPDKLNKFSQAINQYCKKTKNSYPCRVLMNRIKEITKTEATKEPTVKAPKTETNDLKQVLLKCKQLIQKQDLALSESLSQQLFSDVSEDTYACENPYYETIGENGAGIQDFQRAAQLITSEELLEETNKNKLFASLYALYANKIKFQNFKDNFITSKDKFLTQIFKDYPSLKPNYKSTIIKVWKKLNVDAKGGYLTPQSSNNQVEQLNSYAKDVNIACKETYDAYQAFRKSHEQLITQVNDEIRQSYSSRPNFAGGDMIQVIPISTSRNSERLDALEQDFLKQHKIKIVKKIQSLYESAHASHLFATDTFKGDVFDPSSTFANDCKRNPNYKVVKEDIDDKLLNEGHEDINNMLKKALGQNNEIAKAIRTGNKIESKLKDLIEYDPQSVLATLKFMRPELQGPAAARACDLIVKVANSQGRWKSAKTALSLVSLAGAGILIASGIGAPIGAGVIAATTTTLTGAALVEGAMAYEDYASSRISQSTTDTRLALRKSQIKQFLDQTDQNTRRKYQSYIDGGLAAIGSAPAISYAAKGLKTATTTAKVTAAAGQEVKVAVKTGVKAATTAQEVKGATTAVKSLIKSPRVVAEEVGNLTIAEAAEKAKELLEPKTETKTETKTKPETIQRTAASEGKPNKGLSSLGIPRTLQLNKIYDKASKVKIFQQIAKSLKMDETAKNARSRIKIFRKAMKELRKAKKAAKGSQAKEVEKDIKRLEWLLYNYNNLKIRPPKSLFGAQLSQGVSDLTPKRPLLQTTNAQKSSPKVKQTQEVTQSEKLPPKQASAITSQKPQRTQSTEKDTRSIRPKKCTYRSYQWNVKAKRATKQITVRKAYANLTKDERDPNFPKCTLCKEDQETIAINGLPSVTVCKHFAPSVRTALTKLAQEIKEDSTAFKVISLKGYRVGKTRGAIKEGLRTQFSNHSYGTAIDINAKYNGLYRSCSATNLTSAKDLKRCRLSHGGVWDPQKEPRFSIGRDSSVYKYFTQFWKWGGDRTDTIKDFMHFSVTGR